MATNRKSKPKTAKLQQTDLCIVAVVQCNKTMEYFAYKFFILRPLQQLSCGTAHAVLNSWWLHLLVPLLSSLRERFERKVDCNILVGDGSHLFDRVAQMCEWWRSVSHLIEDASKRPDI